ncbi:MAG TPA: hypothetical protein VHF58_00970 [Solirubrobacterales bacterium]|nr:hypothetical protein [Solirubrobacterales bacterium]
MPSERAARLAENESLFRVANERMSNWEERQRLDAREVYFCECSHAECREKIELSKADYERVRSDSALFFVAPGHEILDLETVEADHGDWRVVRKNPEVREIVEAADPRRG